MRHFSFGIDSSKYINLLQNSKWNNERRLINCTKFNFKRLNNQNKRKSHSSNMNNVFQLVT